MNHKFKKHTVVDVIGAPDQLKHYVGTKVFIVSYSYSPFWSTSYMVITYDQQMTCFLDFELELSS